MMMGCPDFVQCPHVIDGETDVRLVEWLSMGYTWLEAVLRTVLVPLDHQCGFISYLLPFLHFQTDKLRHRLER